MSDAAPNSNFTSQKETKKFVTSFAFGVHESLLGMRLASPRRRLMAIFLDLIFIGLLTQLDSFLLSTFILLVTLFSLYKKRGDEGKTGSKVLIGLVAFGAALSIVLQLAIPSTPANENIKLGLVGSSVADKQVVVSDVELLEYENTRFGDDYSLVVSSLKKPNGKVACETGDTCGASFFRALSLDLVEKEYDYDDAVQLYLGVRNFLSDKDSLDKSMADTELAPQLYQQYLDGDHLARGDQSNSASIILWVQGALGDLGLSFGWAALYFSVLTAWWNGQTLGKRMLGIQVVRIDGKQIDLWESIGRYGGYSAGLATGLLGFIQIYWDANRQAIQDKISETLVVRL